MKHTAEILQNASEETDLKEQSWVITNFQYLSS